MDAQMFPLIGALAVGGVSSGAMISLCASKWRTRQRLSALRSSEQAHYFGASAQGNPIAPPHTDPRGIDDTAPSAPTSSPRLSLRDKLFQAGLFTEEDRVRFVLCRGALFALLPLIGALLGGMVSGSYAAIGGVMGLLLALQAPQSYLDRLKAARHEEIMFYMPLVIEQLVLGVSCSLDIGPCIKWVVAMADERDSHNPVTELLRYAQQHMKSGVAIDEALLEVANLSGHTELTHVFMSLAQVTRHGGEISKQLQELANAVTAQREAQIEGKIKKLELEATGPVSLVFVAFMAVFVVSLGTQMMKAFGS